MNGASSNSALTGRADEVGGDTAPGEERLEVDGRAADRRVATTRPFDLGDLQAGSLSGLGDRLDLEHAGIEGRRPVGHGLADDVEGVVGRAVDARPRAGRHRVPAGSRIRRRLGQHAVAVRERALLQERAHGREQASGRIPGDDVLAHPVGGEEHRGIRLGLAGARAGAAATGAATIVNNRDEQAEPEHRADGVQRAHGPPPYGHWGALVAVRSHPLGTASGLLHDGSRQRITAGHRTVSSRHGSPGRSGTAGPFWPVPTSQPVVFLGRVAMTSNPTSAATISPPNSRIDGSDRRESAATAARRRGHGDGGFGADPDERASRQAAFRRRDQLGVALWKTDRCRAGRLEVPVGSGNDRAQVRDLALQRQLERHGHVGIEVRPDDRERFTGDDVVHRRMDERFPTLMGKDDRWRRQHEQERDGDDDPAREGPGSRPASAGHGSRPGRRPGLGFRSRSVDQGSLVMRSSG